MAFIFGLVIGMIIGALTFAMLVCSAKDCGKYDEEENLND